MSGAEMETIELAALDIRLEHTRHKDIDAERRLLSSIMARDIQDPLQVSACGDADVYVLLDGFKRYRCAKKLHISMVPVRCIAQDVPQGVMTLLRHTSAGTLSIMEQAALIEELHKRYSLSIYDIALRLERSPSWVSMRLGIVEQLSDVVRTKIMSGAFPARAYMYGIKGFTRVNSISQELVDAFVTAVSGKGLSTRNLSTLSHAYFTGGPALRQLISEGDVRRALAMVTADAPLKNDGPRDDTSQGIARELKIVALAMGRIIAGGRQAPVNTASLCQYVNLWSDTILKRLEAFSTMIKELYDRSGPAGSGIDTLASGCESQSDSAAAQH